ncbi:MAG TPA: HNH endonuclease [Mycolicibacterium fallax]|nr:HNH endonuclease [Mycolicibacterium fallax]
MFELATSGVDLQDEAALVSGIAELERLKSQAAATQARLSAQLATVRHDAEVAAGVPAARRGRGLAAEIALARHDSPNRGNRHLGFAQALVHEMPHTLKALETGALSEWRATLIVRESACLEVGDRATLDAELCADPGALAGLGDGRIAAAAKAIAYRLDPHAVVDRAVKAEADRCVTIRPAPDNMVYLTALLPMAKGVSVYAALRRAADGNGDGRTRGQLMADTLIERITGRPAQTPEPIAVSLVLSDQTLVGGNDPAVVPGFGPVPANIARSLIAAALDTPEVRATLRRLYAHPGSGALVAMESRSRLFPKGLATLIRFRDHSCRTPYCDAPIRHTDHITPATRGGPTSERNGQGTCEACNHNKQAAGWLVAPIDADRHTTEVTTPTGHHYRSTAPPVLLGRKPLSPMEKCLFDTLRQQQAA